jgi:hypothetical protein
MSDDKLFNILHIFLSEREENEERYENEKNEKSLDYDKLEYDDNNLVWNYGGFILGIGIGMYFMLRKG